MIGPVDRAIQILVGVVAIACLLPLVADVIRSIVSAWWRR